MRISDASFVVTDTETTGMRAGEDRLIELAAVRVENGHITGRFQRLVNPECAVPRRISRLTGITTAMVYDQPAARDVLPQYLEFLGDGILVAHNLSFDLRFLNAALRAAQLKELSCSTLCTLRLARRLLAGLRSKSLGSICDFYRINNSRAHRALGDAEATATILLRFLQLLERDHGCDSIDELIAFQHRKYRSPTRSRHLTPIREKIARMPADPGVYFMQDGTGTTVYVGKARNLRARVSSYFSAIEGHPPRLRKMIDIVRDVEWQVTESELDALILESRLIKKQQPRFNRAQRQYQTRPFLRISTESSQPEISVSPVLKDDGAHYFGPLDSRELADRLTSVIAHYLLPCDVHRLESFLEGGEPGVLDELDAAMRRAAESLDFEEAARLRDWLQVLQALLERHGCIAPAVLEQNGVLAHVSPDDPGSRTLRLHLIRYGRLQESLRLSSQLSARERAELERTLQMYFHPGLERPDRYYVEEVDEVRLIRQWAYTNRSRIERVAWREEAPTGALLEDVVAAVGRLTEA